LIIFIDGISSTSETYLIDDIWDGSTPTDRNELGVIYEDLVWEDTFESKFSVYPNPTNESQTLKIKTSESIQKLELYNLLGQKILHQHSESSQLRVQNIKPGIYLLKIYSGNSSVTKGVVLQ